MSTIKTLKKSGATIHHTVQESVDEIWQLMNGRYDINDFQDKKENRDWMCLTDMKGKKLIIQKRFIFAIEE